MESPSTEIHDLIKDLSDPSEAIQASAIDKSCQLGRQIVAFLRPLIAKKLTNPIRVIYRLGYPTNEELIPDLIEELKYVGGFPPKEQIIAETLIKVGRPVLAYLPDVLNKNSANGALVHALAGILSSFQGLELNDLCPYLIETLQKGLTQDMWYYHGVIELLGNIGSPLADTAISTICEYYNRALSLVNNADAICRTGHENPANEADQDIRRAAIEALSKFDAKALLPVLSTVQRAKQDRNKLIQQAAMKIEKRILDAET